MNDYFHQMNYEQQQLVYEVLLKDHHYERFLSGMMRLEIKDLKEIISFNF